MELTPLTFEYWNYTLNLFFTLSGFITLLTVILLSFICGFHLRKLFHSCADSYKTLQSQYQQWHNNVIRTNKSLTKYNNLSKSVTNFAIILLIPVLIIIAALSYSKSFRGYLFSFRGLFLLFAFLGLFGIYMGLRKFLMSKIAKLRARKEQFESEKVKNISAVLDELTPAMQIGLREKLEISAQATLDKQNVAIKRLEKEMEMYKLDLEQKSHMKEKISLYKWCNECMDLIEKKQINEKKKKHFVCPNECLRKYFEECVKIHSAFEEQGREIKNNKSEIKKLQNEENLLLESTKMAEEKKILEIGKKASQKELINLKLKKEQ